MASKKYSIRRENDEPASFEVDGGVSKSLDEVPDTSDREKLTTMMWILPGITGILGLAFLAGILVVRKVLSPTEDSQHELA